jgi:hypothetical protein
MAAMNVNSSVPRNSPFLRFSRLMSAARVLALAVYKLRKSSFVMLWLLPCLAAKLQHSVLFVSHG